MCMYYLKIQCELIQNTAKTFSNVTRLKRHIARNVIYFKAADYEIKY